MESRSGRCLCDDITYGVEGTPARQGHCHCLDCKKALGASFATIAFFKEEQFTLQSGSPQAFQHQSESCLLYTSPSPRDATLSRMPSSA